MKRFLVGPALLLLSGVLAPTLHAGRVQLADLFHGSWIVENINGDDNPKYVANGSAEMELSPFGIRVFGSDANRYDDDGSPEYFWTMTQLSTVITDLTEGELLFGWSYETADAGSYYDPAGYLHCPDGGPFQTAFCAYYNLTADLDAFSPFSFAGEPPYRESGVGEVSLHPGDRFGFFVATMDNVSGRGTLSIFDPAAAAVPEPSTFVPALSGAVVLLAALRRRRRGRC